MGNENGVWIMRGLAPSDPACIHTAEALADYIEEVGFLPLFRGKIPGFSVEEHVENAYWWTGDVLRDPWEWRAVLARSGRFAYGKFFEKKAGFIAKAWLPYFANYRRDGYDFDALFDDGKATFRQKKIMDVFSDEPELLSCDLKELAGYGKGGEKNFEGILTDLEMATYLSIRDFRQRKNRKGEPYGWAIAVLSRPEDIFGYGLVSSAYGEDPKTSRERIAARVREVFPGASEKEIGKI